MVDRLEELKQEAKELGISFSPNIGERKLAEKIEAHYKSLEVGPPKIKEEEIKEEKEDSEEKELSPEHKMRVVAKELEERARVTHIITITDNDQRENNLTTTVPVTCGNAYFELGTKRIPLNVPVEVEQGFIDVLKQIQIPMAVRAQDGSTKTVLRNRYSISYEDELRVKEE